LDFTDHAVYKRTPAAKGRDQERKGLRCGLFRNSAEKTEIGKCLSRFRRNSGAGCRGAWRTRRSHFGKPVQSIGERIHGWSPVPPHSHWAGTFPWFRTGERFP
jgi:hypothetical protein